MYRRETALSGSAAPDFELNVNTGDGIPLFVQSLADATTVGSHWFAIDRSVLAQAGIALRGPPADQVFAPVPPRELLPIVAASVRWYREHATDLDDAVLNACRALRFASEARWSSKPAAGAWAVERGLAPTDLVSRAVQARSQEVRLEGSRVTAFLQSVEASLADFERGLSRP